MTTDRSDLAREASEDLRRAIEQGDSTPFVRKYSDIYNEKSYKASGSFHEDAERSAKAAAILAGAGFRGGRDFDYKAATTGGYYDESTGAGFLTALWAWKKHNDYEAANWVKSILGTSASTGQAIIPNNFVAGIVARAEAINPWRRIITYRTTGAQAGAAIDIPYEATSVTAALKQGAYGSNKDIRDFSFSEATATLYTIAQIADVGNQLLRQSDGEAERVTRDRLARSFALTEDLSLIHI